MHKADNMKFNLTPLKFLQFLEKLKKPLFLAILGLFCPLLGKNEFCQKFGSVSFSILQLSTSYKKPKTVISDNYNTTILKLRETYLEKTKSQIVNINVRKQVFEIVIMSNGFNLTIFNQL